MESFCQYHKLYRLLRSDEDPEEDGITAEEPDAEGTVHDHVSYGSKFCSQYISTSASWDAIMTFANYKLSYPKRIARINVDKLEDIGDLTFIDLTDEDNRDEFLHDARANNFARKFEEVLIIGEIPPSCIDNVYVIHEPESETDSDSDSGSDYDDYWTSFM